MRYTAADLCIQNRHNCVVHGCCCCCCVESDVVISVQISCINRCECVSTNLRVSAYVSSMIACVQCVFVCVCVYVCFSHRFSPIALLALRHPTRQCQCAVFGLVSVSVCVCLSTAHPSHYMYRNVCVFGLRTSMMCVLATCWATCYLFRLAVAPANPFRVSRRTGHYDVQQELCGSSGTIVVQIGALPRIAAFIL